MMSRCVTITERLARVSGGCHYEGATTCGESNSHSYSHHWWFSRLVELCEVTNLVSLANSFNALNNIDEPQLFEN